MVRYRDANNATLRRTFETKQDALDFKAAVRTDVRRGVYRDDRKALTPFATVAEDWYRTAELSRGWSPKRRLATAASSTRTCFPPSASGRSTS
jgi:hypothetical protein